MFDTLIASGPRPSPSMPRLLASGTLHGIVVAAAILATRPSVPTSREEARESSAIFIAPQPAPRSVPSRPDLGPSRIGPAPSWRSNFEVPTLSAGQAMSALPTVSDLLSRVSPQSALAAPMAAALSGSGAPWAVDSVDEPVEVIGQAPLRYPPALARAAIPGRVEVEFVVDTSGWAEGGSLRALASTRPEFEAAARAAILHTRYRPARAHGLVVRQRVRQTLSFRATAGSMAPASRTGSASDAR